MLKSENWDAYWVLKEAFGKLGYAIYGWMRFEDNKWSAGKIWKEQSVPNWANGPGICIMRLSKSYEMSAERNTSGTFFVLLSQGLWLALVNVGGSNKRRGIGNIENVDSHSHRKSSGGVSSRSSHYVGCRVKRLLFIMYLYQQMHIYIYIFIYLYLVFRRAYCTYLHLFELPTHAHCY